MKLIIAGGRNYVFTGADIDRLDRIHKAKPATEVVSGRASGADAEGERWARFNGIPVKAFPADWEVYGRKAGPIRNKAMAQYADAVALFPGGKGTRSMLRERVPMVSRNTLRRIGHT